MNKLNIKPNMLIVSLDGDGIGRMVGRSILRNDADELHKVSARIDAAQDFILHWAKQHDGIKISGGGDEGVLAIPKEAIDQIEGLRKDIEHAFGYTISVGIGKDLAEAGTALLVAKLRGKDRIVEFSDELKKEIKKAKRRVKEKRATQEEYKLSEAYLEKAEGDKMKNQKTELQDCQYCEQTDGVDSDHCKYCHDTETSDNQEKCPYCVDNQSQESEECPYCENDSHDPDQCPYCKDDNSSGPKQPEMDLMDDHAAQQIDRIQSPDSNNESALSGSEEEKEQANAMGMNPPMPSPDPNESSRSGNMPVASDVEENTSNPESIAPENSHSKEVMEAIVDAIENQTVEGNPNKEQVGQIDDTDLANVGDDTEENVSRPAGYEENTPGDLGLSEDEIPEEPDLNSVLQEGLDSHTDNIQREKVVQLVSAALDGFKSSKNILEKAKEQAPELYQASISMLKAMIEMTKMLGLGEEAQENSSEGSEQDQDENEWNDPFPKHPDQGGERKPGHAASKEDAAEAPKDHKPIGQSIGKLSAKHTTKHVARTPMPPGAVNAKGQQKVIDPKTGKTRWIDRKQGMVQSSTGVPVKSPKQGGNNEPKN